MTKNIKIAIATTFCLGLLSACVEEQETVLEPTDFNVSTTATTYKVGENVRFDLTGDPDMMLFYSGELGQNMSIKPVFKP